MRRTEGQADRWPQPTLPPDLISISALADPAIVVGRDWRVVAANAFASDLFAPRLVGADVRQAIRHPLVVEALREVMDGREAAVREATALGHAEGVFRVRVVALGDGRFLVTFIDITQARLTERMRADFVANASHELRTPLANISGFIETLLGPAADDEPARRRFLEIMAREAARMSRLIDDLLSLSRIELDKYVRPQAPLDLAPLLHDVGKTLAMRLEADGRRLIVEIADDLPQVIADRDQILQVMHNLISNSLKYGQSGTPIRVRAALVPGGPRQDPMVRVSVEDEGEGIAPEHLPRLTERFYRIDTGRSRSMGGTGLGLAIVKHIVDRHRGRLDITSQQGVGTTVSFTLPVVPARAEPAQEPSAPEASAPSAPNAYGHKSATLP
ncbi:MAG: ATP-binding protein [Sphingomonadaceae bacterium]|nr:ATP-binding protein [Sphingomonadaceae bacterium]MDW8414016.1 ATP-binding protein [Thermaurantiacus sp.]